MDDIIYPDPSPKRCAGYNNLGQEVWWPSLWAGTPRLKSWPSLFGCLRAREPPGFSRRSVHNDDFISPTISTTTRSSSFQKRSDRIQLAKIYSSVRSQCTDGSKSVSPLHSLQLFLKLLKRIYEIREVKPISSASVTVRFQPIRVGGPWTFPKSRQVSANIDDCKLATFSFFGHLRCGE